MALLSFNSITLHSPFPSSSSIFPLPTTPFSVSRVQLGVPLKPLNGVRLSTPFWKKDTVIVGAAADDSSGASSPEEGGSQPLPSPESEKESGGNLPVEKLPLESKLKEREEQRLRMKLAKKIRLRRKRLLRKRRLRKKGRWPPSKMKKLKNV